MMRRWLPCFFVVVPAALACVGAAAAAEPAAAAFRLLVNAAGAAASLRCDKAAANAGRCRDDLSLAQVVDALAQLAARPGASPFSASPTGAQPLDVVLGPGTFQLDRAWTIAGWPGASRFGKLSISGAGAGRTVLLGAVAVDPVAWKVVPASGTRLSAAARQHVRVVYLSQLLPATSLKQRVTSGFGEPITPLPLQLLAEGRGMPLARWPNEGWAQTTVGVPRASGPSDAPARSIAIAGGRRAAWAAEPDLLVAGYFAHDWAFERIAVSGVDAADGELQLQGPGTKFGVRGGRRVFVENALSELDAPGEWYFDRHSRALYFWPVGVQGLASIQLALTPNLLRITQSSGVTVAQLALKAATGDAVVVNDCHDIVLADLAISDIGNRGVTVEGGSAVTLRRLALADLGDGGVVLSGGDRTTLTASRHVIEDSRIERYATLSRSYRPAVALYGVGAAVMRNRIADGPHSAIIFGGNEHRIEGNHISDVVTETNDAGAIYTGRDWTARGSVIANNLLQNVVPRLPGTHSVKGIYLDDQASGISVERNVFANVSNAVFIGGGRDNRVQGNLFVASSPALLADDRGRTWQRAMTHDPNSPLRRNLSSVPYLSEPYRSRYPQLARLLDDEPGRIKYNRFEDNLIVAGKDFEFHDGAAAGIDIVRNRSVTWSVFKSLSGPLARYAPLDFELAGPLAAASHSGLSNLRAIPP